MRIRPEVENDHDAVRGVNDLAFGQPDEGKIVDAMRGVTPCISLVAELADEVVGHVLFTPVRIEADEGGPWAAMALGPVAVSPARQREGIGAALVRAGLVACDERDEPVVFVLGHPEYYPRFGFRPAPPLGLRCPWPVPDEVFMVAELRPGAIGGREGTVRYHRAFG